MLGFEKIHKESGDSFIRLIKHWPENESDKRLKILIAHLAIEELAWKQLKKKLTNPEAVEEANLTCYQLICLLEALHIKTEQKLWLATRKLNKIRNDMAYQLNPEGIEDKIAEFIQFVKTELEMPLDVKLKEIEPLSCAILTLHAAFCVLIEFTPETKV